MRLITFVAGSTLLSLFQYKFLPTTIEHNVHGTPQKTLAASLSSPESGTLWLSQGAENGALKAVGSEQRSASPKEINTLIFELDSDPNVSQDKLAICQRCSRDCQ